MSGKAGGEQDRSTIPLEAKKKEQQKVPLLPQAGREQHNGIKPRQLLLERLNRSLLRAETSSFQCLHLHPAGCGSFLTERPWRPAPLGTPQQAARLRLLLSWCLPSGPFPARGTPLATTGFFQEDSISFC